MIKYSKQCDFKLLDKKLQNICNVLDSVLDIEVVATSGFRTPEHNAEVGGSPTSSHLKGLAIDIATPDSKTRFKVLFGGMAAGFKRIGIPKELDHFHFDIDESKGIGLAFKD